MTRIIYAEESSPLAAAYTSYSDSHLDCMAVHGGGGGGGG